MQILMMYYDEIHNGYMKIVEYFIINGADVNVNNHNLLEAAVYSVN
jgi:hypothetical protein